MYVYLIQSPVEDGAPPPRAVWANQRSGFKAHSSSAVPPDDGGVVWQLLLENAVRDLVGRPRAAVYDDRPGSLVMLESSFPRTLDTEIRVQEVSLEFLIADFGPSAQDVFLSVLVILDSSDEEGNDAFALHLNSRQSLQRHLLCWYPVLLLSPICIQPSGSNSQTLFALDLL